MKFGPAWRQKVLGDTHSRTCLRKVHGTVNDLRFVAFEAGKSDLAGIWSGFSSL